MSKIIIQEETIKNPITLIGKEAGLCWGANTTDNEKNYKRGWECIQSQHGRTWEFPEVYMILDGYSARVIREFYTHIAGGPTRLQESTRYVKCDQFNYVTPPSISNQKNALEIYGSLMKTIADSVGVLESWGIPREDAAMLLPLGMETKVVVRMNLRTLVSMANQRLCTRAYWEFRNLMKDLKQALAAYSNEWEALVNKLFVPKCEACGFCTEKKSCGRAKKKGEYSIDTFIGTVLKKWDDLTEDERAAYCNALAGAKKK